MMNAIEFINSEMEKASTEGLVIQPLHYAICVGMARMAYYLGEISDEEYCEIMTKNRNICIENIVNKRKETKK